MPRLDLLTKQCLNPVTIKTAIQRPYSSTDEIAGLTREQVNIDRELVKYKLCHFIAAYIVGTCKMKDTIGHLRQQLANYFGYFCCCRW